MEHLGLVAIILYGAAAVFAIIEIGLTAKAISFFEGCSALDDDFGFIGDVCFTFPQARFLLFTSLWTLLVVIYLFLSLKIVALANKIVLLALLTLTTLFWFAGFIAMAVWDGANVGSCTAGICSDVVAAAVFGAFEWLIFLASDALTAMGSRGGSAQQPVAA
ncbi:hypothetical protein MMC20_001985 [Loxospora ochrophaea]|nr:hypothetical protein [Loxospora ochrophaea]